MSKSPFSNQSTDVAILSDLSEIDGIASLADMDDLIGGVLNRDLNLKELLTQQDNELDQYIEAFVEDHYKEAENLCQLLNEVNTCEKRLEQFELQITDFLEKLTETAEEVVCMQNFTETLHCRVENRKKVKAEITHVYEAIMECGKFCEDIVKRDVDGAFLQEIGTYELKLQNWHVMRSKNHGLSDSAIDREIRPKLEDAAQKVGDKLQHYLLRRFQSLSESGTNIILHQQILETTGQHAFRFLAHYNEAMAQSLRESYISIISEVHSRSIRASIKDLQEVAEYAMLPFDPIINSHSLQLIASNRDICTPSVKSSVVRSGSAAQPKNTSVSRAGSKFYIRDEDENDDSNTTEIPVRSISLASSQRFDGNAALVGSSSSSLSSRMKALKGKVVAKITNREGCSAMAFEAGSTPFAGRSATELATATFEQEVMAIRAIHILEPEEDCTVAPSDATVAASNGVTNTANVTGAINTNCSLGSDPGSLEGMVSGVGRISQQSAINNNNGMPLNALSANRVISFANTARESSKPQGSNISSVPHGIIIPANYMGSVVLDPIILQRLACTNSWVAPLVELLARVVNAVTGERKFIRNFILGGEDSRRADLFEEDLLRQIFTAPLNAVEDLFHHEIPKMTNYITLLASMRAIELVKNYVFRSPSPNPILILSSLFEAGNGNMRRRLTELLKADDDSIQRVTTLMLSPIDNSKFHALTLAKRNNTEDGGRLDIVDAVTQDAAFAALLQPHPIIRDVARLTAKVHALNIAYLNGSYVNEGSDVSNFDEGVTRALVRIMQHTYKTIESLSSRLGHVEPPVTFRRNNDSGIGTIPSIPALIFIINNLGYLLYRWLAASRSIRGSSVNMPLAVVHNTSGNNKHQPQRSCDVSHCGNYAGALHSPNATPIPARDVITGGNSVDDDAGLMDPSLSALLLLQAQMLFDKDGVSITDRSPVSHSLKDLDIQLSDTIRIFVFCDISMRYPTIQAVFVALHIQCQLTPTTPLNHITEVIDGNNLRGASPHVRTILVTESTVVPSEAEFLALVTQFAKGWQDQLRSISSSIRVVFERSGSTQATSTMFSAMNTEFAKRVLNEYYKIYVELNASLNAAAKTYYAENSMIQAKLIGTTALEHELRKILSDS